MKLRKLDGMGAGSNVLDLSQYRTVKRPQKIPPAGTSRVIIDGVIRQQPALKPLLKPEAPALQPPDEPELLQAYQIPWQTLIVATIISAAIPFAVLATPIVQSAISTYRLSAAPAPSVPAIQTPAPIIESMRGTQSLLDRFIAGKAPYGIVIINLEDGQVAGTASDKQFTSASLYKLFVAQSIYKMIDTGQLSMGSIVKGTGTTVETCLNRMITISDNACGVALGAVTGWEKQNAVFKSAGYVGTELYKNKDLKTTAGDTALLLKRLYDGTLLSPNSSQHFLNLLKSQRVNNRLPQGLPAGTVIAHKTGDLFGLLHDAGIVYGPKGAYVIAALSGPWSNQNTGVASFAELSRQVYSEMSR